MLFQYPRQLPPYSNIIKVYVTILYNIVKYVIFRIFCVKMLYKLFSLIFSTLKFSCRKLINMFSVNILFRNRYS
jgi:hypothetical protein